MSQAEALVQQPEANQDNVDDKSDTHDSFVSAREGSELRKFSQDFSIDALEHHSNKHLEAGNENDDDEANGKFHTPIGSLGEITPENLVGAHQEIKQTEKEEMIKQGENVQLDEVKEEETSEPFVASPAKLDSEENIEEGLGFPQAEASHTSRSMDSTDASKNHDESQAKEEEKIESPQHDQGRYEKIVEEEKNNIETQQPSPTFEEKIQYDQAPIIEEVKEPKVEEGGATITTDIIETEKKPTEEVKVEQDEDDFHERLQAATDLKATAAPLMKEGRYSEALQIYERSWVILRPRASDSKNIAFKQMLELQVALYNNMSLCYTNLGDFKNATIYASRVLLIEPHNVKALYRYANGMMNLGEKVKAFEIIKICVEVQKKSRADQSVDPEISKLYHKLKELNQEHIENEKQRQKELFAKMLNTSQEKPKSPEKSKKHDKKGFSISKETYKQWLIPSLCTGLIVDNIMKNEGASPLQRSVVSVMSSAAVYSGFILSEENWMKAALALLPFAGLLGYEIAKSK